MDLPTYTNIWRIEKRLYKLYDFRLPMPLPVGQITVFAAIALPYVLLLTLLGVPFSHSLVWLYLLPPGLVTWLVTRPVLEGKRLPELIRSQLRYLAEPRVWCRMAPLGESDVVVVTSRVWRLSPHAREQVGVAAERRTSRIQLKSRLTRRLADARSAQAPAAAASAQASQRQEVTWQSAQRQSVPAQAQSGPGRSAPVRSGAASARAARAAALRARAADSAAAGTDRARAAAAPPVVPGLGRPVAPGRPAAPPARAPGVPSAGQAPVRVRGQAGPADFAGPVPPPRSGSAQPHPTVRPVPPDQPVVIRDPATPEPPVSPNKWPMRAPTAPPTRSAAGAARLVQDPGPEPGPEPESVPESLSIPRQTASPDAGEPAGASAVVPPPPALAGGSGGSPPRASAAGGSGGSPPRASTAVPDAELETPGEAFSLSETADREPVRLDPARPQITVVNAGTTADPAPAVERMLAGPSVRRGDGISGRVMVVPGGHRPGKPDQLQRDRARAQLPVSGSRRVVVLGCTVGAGQTITALMTGEVLASLRSEPITALDLNPGSSSLGQRGRNRPALAPATSPGSPRLVILGPRPGAGDEAGPDPGDPAAGLAQAIGLFERATSGHQIVLADPSTTVVPRLLSMADQLILVAPASAAATRAIGMTFEWLDAHGHAELASEAIMVMNGVSRRSTAHVEQAERGCIGRCRAIVRVPWDDQLGLQAAKRGQAAGGTVGAATAGAYTALAGVLVVALADQAGPDDDDRGEGDGDQRGPSAIARTGWGPR